MGGEPGADSLLQERGQGQPKTLGDIDQSVH